LLLWASIVFNFSLSALPYGNPSSPSILQQGFVISDTATANLKFGMLEIPYYYPDIKINHRDRRLSYMNPTASGGGVLGQVTLNIKERVELIASIGAEQMGVTYSYSNIKRHYDVQGFLMGSLGGKLVFIEIGNWTLGLGALVYYGEGSPTAYYENDIPSSTGNVSFIHKGWQAGGALSYRAGWLIPYFGLMGRDYRMEMKNLQERDELMLYPSSHLDFFVGATIATVYKVSLEIESHFINDSMLSFLMQIRF